MTVLDDTTKRPRGRRSEARTDAEWAAGWLTDCIELIRQEFVPAGQTLRPVQLAETTVVPIVCFNEEVVAARVRDGLAPALDRVTLRTRLDGGGLPASSPVSHAVFVGIAGRSNLTGLSRLGSYGLAILLCAPASSLDLFELAECDWRGLGVAAASTAGLTWQVFPQAPRRSENTNLRFERLTQLAFG